jgi:hypothetical protein
MVMENKAPNRIDTVTDTAPPTPIIYLAILPGSDRKRTRSVYHYRLAYRSEDPEKPGCVALWEVVGGRMPYQVALERDDRRGHFWHCTCADAIYKAEEQGRVCKHVQGLLEFGAALPRPQFVQRSA